MVTNRQLVSTKNIFESIRKLDDRGREFWLARELMPLLEYSDWRNFENVIKKAKKTVENSYQQVGNHFVEINKMIKVAGGSNKEAKRRQKDYQLTRLACYAIAQNGDPSKKAIALAQSYFAMQTRRQELQEGNNHDVRRLMARRKLSETEKKFSGVLNQHGVDSKGIAEVRSVGDEALFNKSTKEMKHRLKTAKGRPLADYLPTITLKAKDLATEITTFNTQAKNLRGKEPIKSEHVNNNAAVRNLLNEKGIYPERLPAAEDIKKLERRIDDTELNRYEPEELMGMGEILLDIRGVVDAEELEGIRTVIRRNRKENGKTNLKVIYGELDRPEQIEIPINLDQSVINRLRKYIVIDRPWLEFPLL